MRIKKIKNDTDINVKEAALPLLTTQDHTQEDESVIMNMSQNHVINSENNFSNSIIIEKKKRGRKKLVKPDQQNNNTLYQNDKNNSYENVNDNIYDNVDANANIVNDKIEIVNNGDVEKKEKKIRKSRVSKKGQMQELQQQQEVECVVHEKCNTNDAVVVEKEQSSTIVHKKRGRKPRGGKIINENQIQSHGVPEVPNIILHLKCVLSDLKKSNELNSNKLDVCDGDKKNGILCYNDNDQDSVFYSNMTNMTSYENDGKHKKYNKENVKEEEQKETCLSLPSPIPTQVYDPSHFSSKNIHPTPIPMMMDTNTNSNSNVKVPFHFSDKEINDNDCGLECKNTTNKEIWKKILQLKLNFHKNDGLSIQRSSCFWDTCEFDTPPIHIPMSLTKGYGCFCHPECAVAYLMNENIDTSVKFERYYLLNSIYGPIYNYNKSIKPAANPHYLLNKFYGNLTINEYRKLFQCEQIVYMVNKPLTNVLPELYEDNNDFFIGNKIIQNNTIEIKKKVTRNAKSSIINEVFGIK